MSHRSEPEPLGAQSSARSPGSGAYPIWLRLFIAATLTAMVVRSSLNTVMHHLDWAAKLEMFTLPYPLPSQQERDEIRGGHARYATLAPRLASSALSTLRFFNPAPTAKTALHLTSATAWLQYGVVWVHTRLEFLGKLIGVDERWTMFSPSVGTRRVAVRARLHFADGDVIEVRTPVEPDDLTNFVRPFAQRRLQHAINLTQLEDVRTSWCQALTRVHPQNGNGAALVAIDLHKVRHELAPAGADPVAHWAAENRRPPDEMPSWRCNMVTGNSEAVGPRPGAEGDDAD